MMIEVIEVIEVINLVKLSLIMYSHAASSQNLRSRHNGPRFL